MNLIGRDALYGRYWGATEQIPIMHFELCYYQAIDWALAHGLARVEAGAQGEHKIARGYRPVVTHSLHWIADAGLPPRRRRLPRAGAGGGGRGGRGPDRDGPLPARGPRGAGLTPCPRREATRCAPEPTRETTPMALTFYTNPHVARPHRPLGAGGDRASPTTRSILDFGPAMRTPDYLAINPMAKVPALVHDGGTVTEVAGHRHLARRPLPGLGPDARGPRRLLPLDVLRRGPARIRRHQRARWASRCRRGPAGPDGLRQPRPGDRDAPGAASATGPTSAATPSRAPTSTWARRSASAMERGGLARQRHPPAAWGARARDRPAAAAGAAKDDALIGGGQAAHG